MRTIRQFLAYHWPIIVFLVFFGWLFANLLSSHMLLEKSDGIYSGGSSWADLAYHMSLISSFVERGVGATITSSPVFAGHKLSYPFLPDLISAAFMWAGMSLRQALIIPTWLVIMAVVALLYWLAFRMTRSRLGAFLMPFFFFFNGSLFVLRYFWHDFQKSGLAFMEFLKNMPLDYSHMSAYNVEFLNVIGNFILPQRAFIFGMLVGLLVILWLWEYWVRRDRKFLLRAGIAIGILPAIHTHTFVALVIAAVFFILMRLWEVRGEGKAAALAVLREWAGFLIPAVIIGGPILLWLFPHGQGQFLRLQFGWMKKQDSFLWFWFKNMLPYLFVFPVAFFAAGRRLREFYMPFLGIFIISNLFIFQPSEWDNMKLMLWWFIPSIILVAELVGNMGERLSRWRGALIGVLVLSMTLTGAVAVYREYGLQWRLFSRDDLALAQFVRSNAPADALFLTSDKHNHPIPCLTGRQILMGYRGWLWSHGLQYADRERDVRAMYAGGLDAVRLLREYRVGYVLIELDRMDDFGMNKRFFENHFQKVYSDDSYLLFKISFE